MSKKVLIMGPYSLHPIVDKDTVSNLFPDLVGAIRQSGGEPYFLMSSLSSPLSQKVEEYFGFDHVVRVRADRGNGFARIKFILAALKFMRSNQGAMITNLVGAISYGFDAALVGKITGCNSIVRVSGNEVETRKCAGRYVGIKGGMIWLIDSIRQRMAFSMATRIVVMSIGERKRVERLALPTKIHICARGVDLQRFIPRKNENVNGPLRILFVGRNSPEKGWDIFFRVAHELVRDNRFSFTVVGDFPVGLNENITSLGYIPPEEMPSVYWDYDVLLMTSRSEGFPQVMVEAMASGLIPVVPKHLLSDYIVNGANGMLISLNPSEIVEVLKLLAGDTSRIQRMRGEARNWVEKHFDAVGCSGRYAQAVLS